MNTEIARPIEVITAEIAFYKRQAGASILEIGKRLNEAKAQLSHGEWLPWLEKEAEISTSMAEKFMKVAKEYGKSESIPNFGVSKLLALMAVPEEEREQFAKDVNAETLTVKELKKAIAERDEAKRKAELAERKATTAQEDLEAKRRELITANGRLVAHNEEIRKLNGEIESLKNRPVEVAVQHAEKQELDAARAEERTKAEEERKKLEEKLKKEQMARQADAENKKNIEQALEKAEERLRDQENRAKAQERAKELDKAMQAFAFRFREVQMQFESLLQLLPELDDENRKKMRGAVNALCDRCKAAVDETEVSSCCG